jgi:hypothetical protein
MTDTKVTPEQIQIATMKHQIKQNVNSHYANFLNEVVNLPLSDVAKANALTFLDTGLLWLRQGIDTAPISLQPVAEPLSTQPADAQGDDSPAQNDAAPKPSEPSEPQAA